MKTISNLTTAIISLAMMLSLTNCKKDEKQVTYKVVGYAQKGPFVTGANVTIVELDKSLNPTGKTYLTTIEDNSGKFTFPNVTFASSYVQIQVKGQEFDEVRGGVEFSELTLYSIADLSSTSNINVNIFTNLAEARIKTLVDSGMSFTDAKKQAETEVLKLFNLESYACGSSESLDLTKATTDGGVLLLISAIIQSNIGSNMLFQEYVTNLQTDFKDDGKINSLVLQKALATSAQVLSVDSVKSHLQKRYNDLGITISLFDIKPMLQKFLNTTTYPAILDPIFPAKVANTINLISNQDTIIVDKNKQYSLIINCPANNGISNIGIALISSDSSFTTTNADWFKWDNTTSRLMKDMTNATDLNIPFTFTGSGKLIIQLHINASNAMFDYPAKTVIWK